jgi:probable HAF family extracellular repeat protein
VVALGALSGSAVAATTTGHYTFHKVAVRFEGTRCADNLVYALNDAGEYGGAYYCHGPARGLLVKPWNKDADIIFKAPGGAHTATIVTGVASNGDAAVTTYKKFGAPVAAYIRPHAGGNWRHIHDPKAGSAGTAIKGVNSAGMAVGFYYTGAAGSPVQAYAEYDHHYQDFALNQPGLVSSYLTGINDKGQVVGGWTDSGGVGHAFLARNGKIIVLHVAGAGTMPGDGVFVTSLASNGSYAGDVVKNGVETGFVVHDGKRSTPASPKFATRGSDVRAVNRHGTVVGDYLGADKLVHGFIAQPK